MGNIGDGMTGRKSSGGSYTSNQQSTSTGESPLTLSIESLAREQAFEGSFLPSPGLFHLLIGDQSQSLFESTMTTALKSLDDLPASAAKSMHLKRKIWTTLLVIAYLQVNFTAEEDAWSIFSEKAILWTGNALAQFSLDGNQVYEVLKDAQEAAKGIVVKQ
jgi:hypothetical protein